MTTPRHRHDLARQRPDVQLVEGILIVRGVTTNNDKTKRMLVNGQPAENLDYDFHHWQALLPNVKPGPITITAYAEDAAGNIEQTGHTLSVVVK